MTSKEKATELLAQFALFNKGPVKHMHNATRGEMPVLKYLALHGDTYPTEFSQQFHLSTARVANTLNSLEKKEYIERIHDEKDRRKVKVVITEKGKDFVQQKEDMILEKTVELLEYLGEDADEFIRIIKRVKDFMDCQNN